MSTTRLASALSEGLALPEGPVAVFGAPAGFDLSPLTREQVTLISRFASDVAAWQAVGFAVIQTPEPGFAAALVVLPRAKDAARALIAEAAAVAPLVIVDGAKHDGVDAILKAVRARVEPEGSLAKAHGKIFWFSGDFADWLARDRDVGGFVTRPGVFSADGPDKGSLALIEVLPPLKGRVADLGAGWGFLARTILESATVTGLDLIEADLEALDCARLNVTDPRAAFHWADATRWRLAEHYDAVVSNPPFHVSRAGDPGLGQAFIRTAAAVLKPSGQFFMVANRHLPYEAALEATFGEIAEIGGNPGFKVIRAARPHRAARP